MLGSGCEQRTFRRSTSIDWLDSRFVPAQLLRSLGTDSSARCRASGDIPAHSPNLPSA